MPSPFSSSRGPAASKSEAPKAPLPQTARVEDKTPKGDDAKPRFDFYKILPGEDAEKAAKDAQKGSTAAGREAFFLQAGASRRATCRTRGYGIACVSAPTRAWKN
jgi:hypothetical protein